VLAVTVVKDVMELVAAAFSMIAAARTFAAVPARIIAVVVVITVVIIFAKPCALLLAAIRAIMRVIPGASVAVRGSTGFPLTQDLYDSAASIFSRDGSNFFYK
jgi:hypothetical protein